jgi:2,3,4,5-tetrahydropyridine-2,6-dicarboxylate N-succinyltransferase
VKELKKRIEEIYETKGRDQPGDFDELFFRFRELLNTGKIRAAEPAGNGSWKVNAWVKEGILLGFRFGIIEDYTTHSGFNYFDKSTYPLRPTSFDDGIRIVPGGTSIRSGCYVSPGVVIMPPAYINTGAWVGPDTMIDSHALVGSCAQVGARVHLSAAAQIGGVLEPIGASPVIIEDDVIIGGNSGIYEGITVKKGAVIGAGTVLTASVPVYDLAKGQRLRVERGQSLVIPENAVVVPGSRPMKTSAYAVENNLQINCGLIIKYRDEKTDAATALEELLR